MKQTLYLETSVVGAYLDNGEPFRRDLTIRWWEHEMPDYRAVVSPLVERELERVAEPHRSSYLKLIASLEQVELTEEATILAEGYVSRGIFHRKFIADAMHVAIASVHKVDYLVTWNFGHLANVRRQARIKLFNTAAGFYVPMIAGAFSQIVEGLLARDFQANCFKSSVHKRLIRPNLCRRVCADGWELHPVLHGWLGFEFL